MWRIVSFLVALLLSACAAPTTPTALPPTPSTATCAAWTLTVDSPLTCLIVSTATDTDIARLMQSPLDTAIVLTGYDGSLVLDGTVLHTRTADTVSLTILEGQAVVGANGRTRIIYQGQRIMLMLNENQQLINLTEAESVDLRTLLSLPLDSLPRSVSRSFETTPTPDNALALPNSTACAPREGWTDTYVVQSGDVLSRIAERFDTDLVAMIRANCLANASNLQVGQELRVPVLATVTPPPEATPEITDSVVQTIGLRADNYTVATDGCTMLRWDSNGAEAIYLNDTRLDGVVANVEVCPTASTTYDVRIEYTDGTEIMQSITIVVQP